jgi:hypothetical protein
MKGAANNLAEIAAAARAYVMTESKHLGLIWLGSSITLVFADKDGKGMCEGLTSTARDIDPSLRRKVFAIMRDSMADEVAGIVKLIGDDPAPPITRSEEVKRDLEV